MAKKPRYLPPEPSCLVEVSNRTVGSRYLLKPSKVARERIAGVLARAANRYGVQVVFYVFASTHFHLLLIIDDTEQMADFIEYLGSNIARELGRLYEWRQKFWGQPYSHVPVSDEPAAQIARLKYLASNSVKEGLVDQVAQWPGLHAAHEILAGEPLEGTWVDRTYLYNQGRSGNEIDSAKASTTETLELARLPCWKGLSPEAYRERIAEVVREVEEEASIERKATDKNGREWCQA